jgi:hypothetical protein
VERERKDTSMPSPRIWTFRENLTEFEIFACPASI